MSKKTMPSKAKKTDNTSNNFIVNSEKPFTSNTNKSKYASASKRISSSDHLYMYSNPSYTDQELEQFEDVWGSSICGAVIDKLMEYVFGGGLTPVFELKDETGMDDEQKKTELKKYESELKELKDFDKRMGFENKLKDATTMAMVFGRCVMAYEGKGLPKAIKIIHPRDLGRIFIDQKDWSLEKVITTFPSDELEPSEMIYLVNRPDSPKRRTMWYGYSEVQRIVGAARAWRRIVEYDMPEIATSMWAGYGTFMVKKMGRSKADAENDMNTLLSSLKAGAFNAVSIDANDEIEFQKLDLDPKVRELVELASFYERIIIGNFAVPSALLGREEDQNRATLIGKIQFFLSGVVKARREWISDMISKQWYERNMIKMGMVDLLETVEVKAEFENIVVESWFDLVDSVLRIKGIFPDMPDDQLLELLNLEEYKSELAQAPTRTTNVPQGNVPLNSPQDVFTKQLNKTINTTDNISAKKIDDDLIKQALDAKKLDVLNNLDKMIKDASRKTKGNKTSS